MKLGDIQISAVPIIVETFCRKCGNTLKNVSDGLFDNVLFCTTCTSFYKLKLIRVSDKKVNKEFIEQARKETERD